MTGNIAYGKSVQAKVTPITIEHVNKAPSGSGETLGERAYSMTVRAGSRRFAAHGRTYEIAQPDIAKHAREHNGDYARVMEYVDEWLDTYVELNDEAALNHLRNRLSDLVTSKCMKYRSESQSPDTSILIPR